MYQVRWTLTVVTPTGKVVRHGATTESLQARGLRWAMAEVGDLWNLIVALVPSAELVRVTYTVMPVQVLPEPDGDC